MKTSQKAAEYKESRPIKKKIITGMAWISGAKALSGSFSFFWKFNKFLYEKFIKSKKSKFPDDTFKKACLRHGVNDEKLKKIKSHILFNKRIFWVSSVIAIGYFTYGVINQKTNMAIISFLVVLFCYLQMFRFSFRYWQCENKSLAGIAEFFNDSGTLKSLNFFLKGKKKGNKP